MNSETDGLSGKKSPGRKVVANFAYSIGLLNFCAANNFLRISFVYPIGVSEVHSVPPETMTSALPVAHMSSIAEIQVHWNNVSMTILTLSDRGVLTLPAKLRKAMGLGAGQPLIAEATAEGLLLRPATA